MANNLKVGPNVALPLGAFSFVSAGFTAQNCAIIYKVGDPNRSWIPGRDFNQITGFEIGDFGYYIIMLQAGDFTEFVATRIPGVEPGNTYVEEVTADNPIYYNRFNGTGTSLTPLIGSGNISLVGGPLVSQAGAVNGGQSVQFDGTNDHAILNAGFSLYNTVKIEFFAFKDNDYADGGVGLVHGGSDWNSTSTPGGFVANIAGSTSAYLGVTNANGPEEGSYPLSSKGAWHHYVFTITNNGITSVLVDGVSQTITPGFNSPNTTANLLDGNMYIFGLAAAGYGKGRIAELAIYAGTLPNDARFVAHYAARNN